MNMTFKNEFSGTERWLRGLGLKCGGTLPINQLDLKTGGT